MEEMKKTEPAPGYPPEEGCYLRGNDYSPVAVAVILRWRREETPPEIEQLVRIAVENGAALSGTLQTENIGIEKVICNVVANPNIRYLVVCGPESPGHLVGETMLALAQNGVDEQKHIMGSNAPTAYLFNIPQAKIERFCDQVTVIDLVNKGDPEVIRQAVAACYQEEPTDFRGMALFDPGAYPEPPLNGSITWRVINPAAEPKNEEERAQIEEFHALVERARQAAERKRCDGDSNKQVDRLRILFLCTGNSCRSQMAEGWSRALKSDVIDAYSAGIETHGLNPNAVKVMAEAGVDISNHHSKNVKDLMDVDFDYVITVCGHANETCPMFPGKAKVVHVGFDDPPKLAADAKTEEEALSHYRRVRDEIRAFIERLPGVLEENQ